MCDENVKLISGNARDIQDTVEKIGNEIKLTHIPLDAIERMTTQCASKEK